MAKDSEETPAWESNPDQQSLNLIIQAYKFILL